MGHSHLGNLRREAYKRMVGKPTYKVRTFTGMLYGMENDINKMREEGYSVHSMVATDSTVVVLFVANF